MHYYLRLSEWNKSDEYIWFFCYNCIYIGGLNMEYSKDCPFCMNTRFKNNKLVNLPSEECILFENNNIYVQVDISPLCTGHIRIITKEHYLNF